MLISKKTIRAIARNAWIQSNGNTKEAEKIAKEEVRCQFGIVTYLVIIYYVIAICHKLWTWWLSSGIKTPPQEPMPGEPS